MFACVHDVREAPRMPGVKEGLKMKNFLFGAAVGTHSDSGGLENGDTGRKPQTQKETETGRQHERKCNRVKEPTSNFQRHMNEQVCSCLYT